MWLPLLLDQFIAGYVTDEVDLRSTIENIWFSPYKRGSPADTSGFEHVFAGEYKKGTKVNGFHNWVRFYLLEKDGEMNYYGYVNIDQVCFLISSW